MKSKMLFLALLASMLTFTMSNCGDSDDDLLPNEVPAVVQESLKAMFPNAVVKWERERGMYKAEFINNEGKDVDVYFQKNGTWVRTVTDVFLNELPQVVKDYVAANYADRYIDDADWIETPESDYYLLELEKHGAADIYLKITADGVVIK